MKAKMKTKKPNSSEINKVWKLKDKGLSNREIGERLGRKPDAISHIIRKTHDYWHET
jgi:IS30 family transposase